MKLKFGLLAKLWSGRWISGDTCPGVSFGGSVAATEIG
jgi:hypothetical protein